MNTKKKIIFIILAIILAGALGLAGFYCGSYLTKAKNPTYQEVVSFLEKNSSAQKKQLSPEYDQLNFAIDFRIGAKKAGLNAGVVPLSLESIGYYINAFDTKDMGLIYVDPQADKIVAVEIGKSYWEQNGFTPIPEFDNKVIKAYPPIW